MRVVDLALRGDAGSWATVRAGKGKRCRKVPLLALAKDALRNLIQVEALRGQEMLFPGAVEPQRPMTRATADKTLKALALRAGIRDPVSAHVLQHTEVHRLPTREVGLERVATVRGHTGLDTTRRYVAPSEQELSEASERAWECGKARDLLWGARPGLAGSRSTA